jgi:hypothetical protein
LRNDCWRSSTPVAALLLTSWRSCWPCWTCAPVTAMRLDGHPHCCTPGTRDIAEQVAALYWPQVIPYRLAGTGTAVELRQITLPRAAVVQAVSVFRGAAAAAGTTSWQLARHRRRCPVPLDLSRWQLLICGGFSWGGGSLGRCGSRAVPTPGRQDRRPAASRPPRLGPARHRRRPLRAPVPGRRAAAG